MPKITRLKAQLRDKNRVNVEVDGQFVTGLSLEEVVKEHLKVGMEVDEKILSHWKELDDSQLVLNKVINFLSYRPRTTSEVTTRLARYTESAATKQYVMDYLSSHALLNDAAFAGWWVKSRGGSRSKAQLRQELRLKGVVVSLIDEVLKDNQDEHAALIAIMQKKGGADKARLFRYCASKGFSYDLIKQVFHELYS